MDSILAKKITVWILSSIILVMGFFIGLFIVTLELATSLITGMILIPVLLVFDYLILNFLKNKYENSIPKKKIWIWIYLSVNYLFAFTMGATIPFMESKVKYNMGIVMIPLLIALNYIIVDRFHYLLKLANTININSNEEVNENSLNDRPVIEFDEKKYIFTTRSIILLFVGTPILSYAIYYFFDMQANYWLHEIVVKQTVFFLNLLFNMGAETEYFPRGMHHWSFSIPDKGSIYFQTFCTGVQAICVFAGIIIFIPHSLDSKTNEDIIWRKTKALIASSILFYVVNIIRMIIQIYLFYIGYAWEDIHYSISAASSFVAAIIILLLHAWIPEFIISIIYGGSLINKKVKETREANEEVND